MINQLEYAPLPLVVIDEEDVIRDFNARAERLGFQLGTSIGFYVQGIDGLFAEMLDAVSETKTWQFSFTEMDKKCKVFSIKDQGMIYCWLQDLSEHMALAEKLRNIHDPASKQLRQINHMASTAMGYAELLEVIMTDHDSISADRLSAVRQYQKEVRETLQSILHTSHESGRPRNGHKVSILVAESHETLNELISELLKSEGYRVANFMDAESVVKYYRLNQHSAQKAIIDESLTCLDGRNLAQVLREIDPGLDILTLTNDDNTTSDGAILKPVDFQKLLRAVET